jgi:hypothetical protein
VRKPYAAILFAINTCICWRVFGLEWSKRMDSIEGAYIGISRHILASWPDLSWWPAWYAGIPFRNSYPPLLNILVALSSAVLNVSVARAHHVVTALFYCAGPVFTYLMMARLSRRRFPSFCAALLYSVVSPVALMVHKVALDMGHPLRPRRLGTLIAYGDGPHIAALALVPLALYCLDLALEKRTPIFYGVASLSMIAVVYTNWLGALALAVLVLCYLAAGRPWRDWRATACLAVGTYLAAMPWIPPSLIHTIQFNAQTVGGNFSKSSATLMHAAPFALAAFAALKFLMQRMRAPAYLQMVVFFSAAMGCVGLGYSWFGWAAVPQPERYHLEIDLGITLALGMGAALLPQKIARIAAAFLFLFSVEQVYRAYNYSRDAVEPIDISSTVEYRIAKWFDAHMGASRVFVPGSIEFWLQAFTETPQVGGGFEQGNVNFTDRIAEYQILSDVGAGVNDVAISLLWLKAFGVQAVVSGGPKSREQYHAFANGEKFKGVLAEYWREGDDAIYRVPQRNNSLAHVMRAAHLVAHAPYNGMDTEQLRTYVDAIDDPALPEATFVWRTNHSAEILTHAQANHVVSVQVTYDPGFHARANGRPAPIFRDGLGWLAIEPHCAGECRIELVYDGGLEDRVARWLRGITILCWAIWVLNSRKRLFTGFWATSRL